MTLLQRWRQTSLPNKLLIETGTLVAIGTLFYAGAAIVQVCILKESSQQTAQQNERVITEAKRVAKSAEDSLSQSRAAMEASIAQSKTALDASLGTFRIDQRAWLSVVSTDAIIEIGKPLEFWLHIKNTGKTFAKRVRIHSVGDPLLKGEKPDFSKNPEVGGVAILAPNSEYVNAKDLSIKGRTVDEPGLAALRSGLITVYLHGRIEYDDIFGIPHWTTFCYVLDATSHPKPEVNVCKEHNDADDTPE